VLLLCGAGRLEGQLAAEKQAHSTVSSELVAAQREMEGLVRRNRNLELELANAAVGEEAHQVQVEQKEMRASWEAQSAEVTSVKVSTPALSCSKTCMISPLSHPLFVLLHSALAAVILGPLYVHPRPRPHALPANTLPSSHSVSM